MFWLVPMFPLLSVDADDSSLVKPIVWFNAGSLQDGSNVVNLADTNQPSLLRGSVQIADGNDKPDTIRFDGKSGAIEIQLPQAVDLGAGKTILARLQFDEVGSLPESPGGRAMIFCSPGHYLFGRSAKSLYTNIRDAEKWAAPLYSPQVIEKGVRITVAAVFQPVDIPEEGRKGWLIKQFLNGTLIAEKEFPVTSVNSPGTMAFLGSGLGDSWFFGGEIEDFKIFDQPLSDGQIKALSETQRPSATIAEDLAKTLADVDRVLSDNESAAWLAPMAWIAGTIRQHAGDLDQSKAAQTLQTLRAFCLKDSLDQDAVIRHANSLSPQLRFFLPKGSNLGLCWKTGLTADRDVILSLYDFVSRRELLGQNQILWKLSLAGNERTIKVAANDPNVTCHIALPDLNQEMANGPLHIVWNYPAPDDATKIELRSDLHLSGNRLSMNLDVSNLSRQWALTEATFPAWRLRALDGPDELAVPKMSGVLLSNPVADMKSYEGIYPSAGASMQFGAYYNRTGGIYIGCEDPEAQSKALVFRGIDGELLAESRWFVGQQSGGAPGGNDLQLGLINVLETFSGSWFEAARIYRKFAESAPWWPTDPSRPDSPEAFKQIALWLRESEDIENAVAFAKYLGVPVGYHWYNWHAEPFDHYYPQFTPRPDFKERLAKLEKAGILVKLYLNAMLWARLGPGKDPAFSKAAQPSAVRLRDGSIPEQIYPPAPNGNRFMIMCPAAPFWQEKLVANSLELASLGAGAIYLDQLAAAKPIQCFSEDHGHVPGTGTSWVTGYRKILKNITGQVRQKTPGMAFDSEDASEPYTDLLDGFMPWRSLDNGQIPMFNAVYGGRIQFTGRVISVDEGDATYAKIASQAVNNEQLGWMSARQFNNPMFADFSLFVKKMAHLRQALLPIFNGGDMGPPVRFSEPPAPVTTHWKGFGIDNPVTLPAIQSGVWRRGGVVALVFVNSTHSQQDATVQLNAADMGLPGDNPTLMRFDEARPEGISTSFTGTLQESIRLPAHQAALWLLAPADHPEKESLVSHVKSYFTAARQFKANIPEWADSEPKSAKNWLGTGAAESYFGCLLVEPEGKDEAPFFGKLSQKSLIYFGDVDFGKPGTQRTSIEVQLRSMPDLKGGTLVVRTGNPFDGPVIAESQIPRGRGAFELLTIPVKDMPKSPAKIFFILDRQEGTLEFSQWRLSSTMPH